MKSTAETLKPTLKSEEMTTQFFTDEEATDCGDGCVENGGISLASENILYDT